MSSVDSGGAFDWSSVLDIVSASFSFVDWTIVAEVGLGLFSYAVVLALWERFRTTQRLRKYISSYQYAADFEWTNQTEEFVLMHRVRSFEVLLRRVQALQPRTPIAYGRVEEVRDAIEYFHRTVSVFRGEHMPLPSLTEFPFPKELLNASSEVFLRTQIFQKLREINWLQLDKVKKNS